VVERGGGACGACPEWGGAQAAQASSCAARCRTCSSAHVPRALPARAKRGGRSYSRCWHNSGVGQCPPLRGSSSVGKSEAFQARARAMNLFRVKVCQSQQSVRPRSTRFVSPHAQALIVCAGQLDWSCADAAAADPSLSAVVGVNGNAGLSPSAAAMSQAPGKPLWSTSFGRHFTTTAGGISLVADVASSYINSVWQDERGSVPDP